jgi:hypothetical protein
MPIAGYNNVLVTISGSKPNDHGPACSFDADGNLNFLASLDGHLYRVHWKPDDAATLPTTNP